jgi:C4-dicarboxylate transporter/malic acid transport protein
MTPRFTGIMSVLFRAVEHQFPGMDTIGTVFFFANIVFFCVFTSVSIARYVLYPWVFGLMINDANQSLFLGTFPMGLATIVNGIVLIAVPHYGQWAIDLAWTLWWIDVVLSLITCLGMPAVIFSHHDVSLDRMTAALLLPIVPAVVAGSSGGLVASVLNSQNAMTTLLVSYVLWGMGVSLSLMVMALYIHRLLVHKMPQPEVIVSAFLPLGPCGQGAYGIIQLGLVGQRVFTELELGGVSKAGDIIYVVSIVEGAMLWGLGLFWLVHGTVSVCMRWRGGMARFNMGYWGFIFPLGVFIAGTIALGKNIPSAFFAYLSLVLLAILFFLYVLVAGATLYGGITGTLLVAPCLSKLEVSAQNGVSRSTEAD